MKQPPSVSSELVLARSRRLQAMRQNQQANQSRHGNEPQDFAQQQMADLQIARQLIDDALHDILAALPAGKHRRLFKIRYGVELDAIQQMPLTQVFAVLGIHTNLLTKTRHLAELNYNGQRPT